MKCLTMITITATMLLSGCGSPLPESERTGGDTKSVTPAPVVPTTTAVGSAKDSVFRGSVISAFEISVDGVSYADMEAFFTSENAHLPQKVAAAGYDSSWEATLNARVGLSDLWTNMTVYLAPSTKRGYQAQGAVGHGGSFELRLPEEALDSEYKVRAVKRIAITLRRGDETIRICYNFSAMEKSVPFSEKDKPIVLDTFSAAVTTYDCEIENAGISVPTASAENTVEPILLKAGMSKADVATALGKDSLFVESPTRWCWTASSGKPDACATEVFEKCQCFVEFGAGGKVGNLSNINAKYLDLID